MTYTRNDLASLLARKFDLNRRLSRELVEEILVQIASQLTQGHRVEFRGFGVFRPVTRKARLGRNPKNAASGNFVIPERRVVVFRAGRDLDAILNQV